VENDFLPSPIWLGKPDTFNLQNRSWAHFVWSFTPWSQEVVNVMACEE
jgi:hypothetical protein